MKRRSEVIQEVIQEKRLMRREEVKIFVRREEVKTFKRSHSSEEKK